MIVKKKYIRQDDLIVRLTDSLYHVYEIFDEYRVSHLPIVSDKGKFLGLLSEKEAFDFYDTQKNIKDNNIPFQKDFINEDDSLFYGIKLMSDHQLSLIPVICNKEMYKGYLLPIDVISQLGLNTSISSQGGLVSLKVQNHDYSLNEISRIVESDNAVITTLYIEDVIDEQSMLVHLKINTEDLARIIRSLERFKYDVHYVYQSSSLDDDTEFRFNSFMKFLNP